jgi:hypothetical protein
LRFDQTTRPNRVTSIIASKTPSAIAPLLRYTARAFFARRILVTEGNTEIGLLLGVRENWPERHASKPIEQLGGAIADGNGSQTPLMTLGLASLGYKTAIYRDSDTSLSSADLSALGAAGIPIFEYGGLLNTEQAIFSAASDALVQELLVYARTERGDDAVDNNLSMQIADLDIEVIRGEFATWGFSSALDGAQLRAAIAEVAHRKGWFKDQRIARGLAPIVWKIITENPAAPIAHAILQAETWLYA